MELIDKSTVDVLLNLGYPISTNGEIPTYEETFDGLKKAIIHRVQKKIDRVLLDKSISLSSGGIKTETLLKDNYMQAYKEGIVDILKLLKELCN